ncbi:MAG: HAD family hydrolase [Myxococcota bacterium]
MRADGLVFDLDGTLWDTNAACARAWNRVLRRHEIAFRELTAADLRGVAGLPHDEAVRSVLVGLDGAEQRLVSAATRDEDNRAVSQSGGILFPGVREWIPRLGRDLPLMIVSNCQSGYIEAFLESSGLGTCFSDFECWGRTGRIKAWNLGDVVRRNGLTAPLFVGDTLGDLEAARECGVRFVHARYGFGRVVGADAAIDSFGELGSRVVTDASAARPIEEL